MIRLAPPITPHVETIPYSLLQSLIYSPPQREPLTGRLPVQRKYAEQWHFQCHACMLRANGASTNNDRGDCHWRLNCVEFTHCECFCACQIHGRLFVIEVKMPIRTVCTVQRQFAVQRKIKRYEKYRVNKYIRLSSMEDSQ